MASAKVGPRSLESAADSQGPRRTARIYFRAVLTSVKRNPVNFEKPLPHSADAEKAILAAFLLDSPTAAETIDSLEPRISSFGIAE